LNADDRPTRAVESDAAERDSKDNALRQVHDFRDAARRLLRSDLSHDARAQALDRLFQRAKSAPLADLTLRAIVAEVSWSIDHEDVHDLTSVGDRAEQAHRSLRARGFERCPECWCQLSTEIDWNRWRQLRQASQAELEAREGAVP
jgi:hypothetical protein